MLKPAIILSGYTMALGVTRALGEMGVPIILVHHNKHDIAHLSRYVTEEIQAPNPSQCEDTYVEFLLQQAKRLQGSILIPASDATLTAVSRYKEVLDKYFIVACTEWEITRKFIDKKYTHLLAEQFGVPAPRTIVPRNIADVEEYLRYAEFPCLVKPSQCHLFLIQFKHKMVKVENPEQLISVYEQAAAQGLEVMLQEIIPGDDSLGVNYNAYVWDGEPMVEFTAQQLRNAPPDFGSPRVVISKEIPEVIEPGRRILQAMGFYGYACTEFKLDPRDGMYKLMEVNGRHNLSSLLAVRCGINFPWLQYQHLTRGQRPSAHEHQQGIYWIDIYRDVRYSLMHFNREKLSLRQYLQPYIGRHIFAIFELRDLKPFIKLLAYLAKEAALKAISKLQRNQMSAKSKSQLNKFFRKKLS